VSFEINYATLGVPMLDKQVPAEALEYLTKRGHVRAGIKAVNFRFLDDPARIAGLFPASMVGQHRHAPANRVVYAKDEKTGACWRPLWAIVLPFDQSYGVARIEYQVDDLGDTNGPGKYLSPTGPVPLYFPPTVTRKALLDPSKPLYVVEGQFKSVVAGSKGVPCIGVNGHAGAFETGTGCSKLRADLHEYLIEGREVALVTDADVRGNLEVRRSQLAFMDIVEAAFKCKATFIELPDLGNGKTGIDDYFAGHTLKDFNKLPRHVRDSSMISELGSALLDLTENGLGQRFVAQHGRDIRHDPKAGQWYSWTPKGYMAGDVEPRRAMVRTVEALKSETMAEHNEASIKARKKFENTAGRNGTMNAALELAAIDPKIEINGASFDADPNLLGVQNGVLDLRSGELLEPSRELMVTKSMACAFNAKATAPEFTKFIDTAIAGDKDLRRHIQEILGAALLGRSMRMQMHIIYGPTATGKSVLIEIALALLGEYGMASKSDLLLRQRRVNDPERASPYLKTLIGRRLVVCSELNEGTAFDDALIKDLTGGDTVPVRGLHEAPVTFKNTATIWVRGNHLPVIGTDAAMRERVIVTPMEHAIPEGQRDKDLAARIIANELPGVLNWALVGMRRYVQRGLEFQLPAAAIKATIQMQRDSDIVGLWLAECIDVDMTKTVLPWRADMKDVVRSYREWSAQNGHQPKSSTTLYKNLRARFGVGKDWPLKSDGQYIATGFRIHRHPVPMNITEDYLRNVDQLTRELEEAKREIAALTPTGGSAPSARFRAPVIPIKRVKT
jgi:P4 family phage/plasmid primase-like protien